MDVIKIYCIRVWRFFKEWVRNIIFKDIGGSFVFVELMVYGYFVVVFGVFLWLLRIDKFLGIFELGWIG